MASRGPGRSGDPGDPRAGRGIEHGSDHPINGVPTRARVPADSRIVAWTVFVSGDSYLNSGFSTRTGILDLASDKVVMTVLLPGCAWLLRPDR
jgi:hypothetical protein